VIPQVCTSLGPQALTAQLTALQSGRNLMASADAQSRAARAPVPIGEILAIRNACPAAIGSDLDLAAAAFLTASPTAYRAALLPP
jgi:carboxyl-terminal processing protease